MDGAPSGAPPPSWGEAQASCRCLFAKLGRGCVARTMSPMRPRVVQRSGGWGTMRSMVEEACSKEVLPHRPRPSHHPALASRASDGPPSPLSRGGMKETSRGETENAETEKRKIEPARVVLQAVDAGRSESAAGDRVRGDQRAQREIAFAAIRRLYAELLPLWRACGRGACRRHRQCAGDSVSCVKRCWPLMPPDAQQRACEEVMRGGPRRLPPATHSEGHLRGYPPTNFVL